MYEGGKGGPQWTSEIWYGQHDTTGGNIGDSSSAMVRFAHVMAPCSDGIHFRAF
jgi:hypothetical protein